MDFPNKPKQFWNLNNGCLKPQPSKASNYTNKFHHTAYLETITNSPNKTRRSSSSNFPEIPYLSRKPIHHPSANLHSSPRTRKQFLKRIPENHEIPKKIPLELLNPNSAKSTVKSLTNLQPVSKSCGDRGDNNQSVELNNVNYNENNYLKNGSQQISNVNEENVLVQKAANSVLEKFNSKKASSSINLNYSDDSNRNFMLEKKVLLPREVVLKNILNNLTYTEEMLRKGVKMHPVSAVLQAKKSTQLRVVEEFSNLGKRKSEKKVSSTSVIPKYCKSLQTSLDEKGKELKTVSLKRKQSRDVTSEQSSERANGSLIESIKAKIFAKQKDRKEDVVTKEQIKFPKETEAAIRMMLKNKKPKEEEKEEVIVPIPIQEAVEVRKKVVEKDSKAKFQFFKESVAHLIEETMKSNVTQKTMDETDSKKKVKKKRSKKPKPCNCLPCCKNLLCQRGEHVGECELVEQEQGKSENRADCQLSSVNLVDLDLLKISLIKIPTESTSHLTWKLEV